MPAAITLSFVATVSLAMQWLIFAYLYRSNRARFFCYLVWAWGGFFGYKALGTLRYFFPDLPGVDGVMIFLGVIADVLVLASGLAFRWDYSIRLRHALPVLAYAVLAARYGHAADVGITAASSGGLVAGFVGGFVLLLGGLAFWPRRAVPAPPAGTRFLAVSLVLWGLHRMIVPFVPAGPGSQGLLVVNVSFIIIYFLAIFAIVIVVLDQARGEAATLKEFNERLVDGLGEGLQLVDESFRVRHANRWMGEALGASAGRRCHEPLTADARPCPGCPMGSRTTLSAPVRLHVVGPRDRQFELTCSPVRQPDGRVFLLELVADVTEREQLRGRLAEAERLASIGELAAGMAHEIRNPLAAIVNATALLGDEQTLGPEERAATIGAIRKEARRLNSILSDFLRFARPREPKRVTGDIRGVVAHVAALVGERRVPALAIEARVEPDVPAFAFDPDQLTQVLWNVSLNAVEAMGGQGRLLVHGRREGHEIVIEVADTGRGLPPEELRRIFEPFYSRRAGGTGLGLPIARRIVAAHGGRIDVESGVGAGTRVFIRLPVS